MFFTKYNNLIATGLPVKFSEKQDVNCSVIEIISFSLYTLGIFFTPQLTQGFFQEKLKKNGYSVTKNLHYQNFLKLFAESRNYFSIRKKEYFPNEEMFS